MKNKNIFLGLVFSFAFLWAGTSFADMGGSTHTCAIKSGTVYCWGYNDSGQLGTGNYDNSLTPVQVAYLSGMSQVSAGGSYTCAHAPGGYAYCWGYGIALGNGSDATRTTPVEVKGVGGTGNLTDVSQIATGSTHACAVKNDGTVYCWGQGDSGQLGNNSSDYSNLTPVQVKGVGGVGNLTGIVQVETGLQHTCAVRNDGSVYCWGNGADGQLGDDYTSYSSLTPVQVKGVGGVGTLAGVSQISLGDSHVCAIKNNGSVFCWGNNSYGQLGNDSTLKSATPVQVKGVGGSGNLSGASQIVSDNAQSCIVHVSSGLFCWGNNSSGQLGDDTTTQRKTPVQVLGIDGGGVLEGISKIGAGYSHTCALKWDGSFFCWGQGSFGQLGDNLQTATQKTPVRTEGYYSDTAQTVVGDYHTCSLKSDGTVFCWGSGDEIDFDTEPIQVLDVYGTEYLADISQLAAGGSNTCALNTTGLVVCWNYGETPAYVQLAGGAGNLSNVTEIASGSSHRCALKNTGTVFCWGSNWDGALGNNTRDDSVTPVQVLGDDGIGFLTNVQQIAAGGGQSCARKSDGTVFCWGSKGSGVLRSLVPDQIKDDEANFITNVTRVTVGGQHACALKSDSSVFCWGNNEYGQLGDDSTTDSIWETTQVQGVSGSGNLSGMARISAGGYHTCAVSTTGDTYCWGDNVNGQLGINENSAVPYSPTPVQVLGVGGSGYLSDIDSIATGNYHNCANTGMGGLVYCWGYNEYGQLGDGVPVTEEPYGQLSPVQVVLTTNGYLNLGYQSGNVFNLNFIAGLNGTISGTTPQAVTQGQSSSAVTAVADSGYQFVDWSDGITINPRTESVERNVNVLANFELGGGPTSYTFTYTAGPNGSITGTTPQTVAEGADGSAVTAVPDTGYHFVDWNDASTSNPRTGTNASSHLNLTANFAINTYTLAYSAGSNGSLTGTASQAVNYNSSGSAVTAVPDSGYHFVNWSDSSTSNPRTDTNVQSNISVTANFAVNSGTNHTLTYAAGTGGTISGTTPQSISDGSNGSAVTAVPGTGHHFVNWSDSSTQNPRTDTNVTTDISVTANFALDERIIIDPTPQKILDEYGIGVISIQDGATSSTSRATMNTKVTLRSNGASLVIPTGTEISKSGGGSINITNLTVQNIAATIRDTVPSSKGAIKVGILDTPIDFTNDVTISFSVDPSYNGETLTIYSRPDSGGVWTRETTCLIADALCSFSANHATEYTGNTEVSNSPQPTDVNVDINATITIDCKDAASETNDYINMNSITGTGQSTANGNNDVKCNVITNNSSGYTLSFTSSTPELINANSDTIGAYSPSVTNTPETWSVSTANSEWGARLQSSSSTYNPTLWGSIGTDDYTTKWYAVTNSNSFTLANRATETAQIGDNQIIRFGAEIGAGKFQPTGTYDTDVTFTAVTN